MLAGESGSRIAGANQTPAPADRQLAGLISIPVQCGTDKCNSITTAAAHIIAEKPTNHPSSIRSIKWGPLCGSTSQAIAASPATWTHSSTAGTTVAEAMRLARTLSVSGHRARAPGSQFPITAYFH
jgi:hypothetical protein